MADTGEKMLLIVKMLDSPTTTYNFNTGLQNKNRKAIFF